MDSKMKNTNYHYLTTEEISMVNEYFIKNLQTINTILNIDVNSLNEHHFYNAIQSMFPTWRTEQLYNYGNNVAYINYIDTVRGKNEFNDQTRNDRTATTDS